MTTSDVVVAVASVIVVAAVQLPAWGIIGPNPLVGIRVATTRQNRESWLRVHKMAAPFVWTGACACWVLLVFDFAFGIIDSSISAPLGFASLIIGLLVGSWLAVTREKSRRRQISK